MDGLEGGKNGCQYARILRFFLFIGSIRGKARAAGVVDVKGEEGVGAGAKKGLESEEEWQKDLQGACKTLN